MNIVFTTEISGMILVLYRLLSARSFGSLTSIVTQAIPLTGSYVARVKNISKYPYVVSIAQRNDHIPAEETHICTGSLIENNFVLTAAHCFEDKTLDQIRLIAGSVDLRKGKTYNASMWITYDQWADSKNITKQYPLNDIAVVKLLDKLPGRLARPVNLSYKKASDLIDEYVVLVGWGRTQDSPDKTPRYLHEVKIRVLPRVACENELIDFFQIVISLGEKTICTRGEPHAHVSPGDSGGPLLRKNSLLGINSFECVEVAQGCVTSDEVFEDHKFNIHTAIDFFREFIADVKKNY